MCYGNGSNPVGTVNYFARQFPPEGWLLCDGREVSRDVFVDLFNMVGASFGAGDGKTTFNLPDLRGEFIRGFDMGRGVDSGRQFGSVQSDGIKKHDHALLSNQSTGSSYIVPQEQNGTSIYNGNLPSVLVAAGQKCVASVATSLGGDGSETRPSNVALLACIKY
jgi:microcystin-dependent protein